MSHFKISDRRYSKSWNRCRCSNSAYRIQQEGVQKFLPVISLNRMFQPEVYFSIKKSETKATKLDNFFRDDFERGKTDKFIVNMKDIGDPLLCKLGKFKIRVIRTFSPRAVADRSNGIQSETFHIVWMLQV